MLQYIYRPSGSKNKLFIVNQGCYGQTVANEVSYTAVLWGIWGWLCISKLGYKSIVFYIYDIWRDNMIEETLENDRGSIKPSAFAVSVVFGGGLGLTISQIVGFRGDAGFLIGFVSIFVFLAFSIWKYNAGKNIARINELENEIIDMRKALYKKFIGESILFEEPKEEQDDLKHSIQEIAIDLRQPTMLNYVNGVIRSFGNAGSLRAFVSHVDSVTSRIRIIEKDVDLVGVVKAIDILKKEANDEIIALEVKGEKNEAN